MKINDPQKSTFLGCNNKEKITRSIYIELKLEDVSGNGWEIYKINML